MSVLRRILKPGGDKGWSSVDLTPDGLCAVTVSPPATSGGKILINNCVMQADSDLDSEVLAKIGRTITKSGNPWVLVMPRRSYNILVIAEPPVKSEEMAQSLRWTISPMVDYPVEDAQIAWMRIPTADLQPGRPPHVYVVSTRAEPFNTYKENFSQAKLPLQAVDIRETAYRNMATLVERPGEGVALLSIGKFGVQLTISYRGELYLDRFVEEVGFDPKNDEMTRERACERVVLQVQRSLDFVSRTLPFIEINRLILAPMQEGFDISSYFSGNLPIPVEPYDFASAFDYSAVPELATTNAQALYFVAIGAALRFLGSA